MDVVGCSQEKINETFNQANLFIHSEKCLKLIVESAQHGCQCSTMLGSNKSLLPIVSFQGVFFCKQQC
jgi:hypothetical protein